MRRSLKATLWHATGVVAVLVGCALGNTKHDASNQKRRAVGVARLISTAELNYFRVNGGYASLAELVKSGQLRQAAIEFPENLFAYRAVNLQSDSQPVAGFVLGLLVAADGSAYRLSLTQKTDECGLGLFTDERGILYEGKTIDCATEEMRGLVLRNWAPPNVDQAVPPVRTDMPCPLSQLLDEAGSRVQELEDNLQRFSARERIEHWEVGKNGKPHSATTRVFNYVAEIHKADSQHTYVEEYRSGATELVASPMSLTDTGTATFALIFYPRYIGEFAVYCEGLTDLEARPVWQLHFAQRPDRPSDFHAFRVNNISHPVKLKGRAWIAADTHEVLRLETDLIEPIMEIDLQMEHLIIQYGAVEFRQRKVRLWLPESAALYIDYHRHRYQRRHNFSDFQLFWVETGQEIKEPHQVEGAQSQTN